jgi:hypothetical protein
LAHVPNCRAATSGVPIDGRGAPVPGCLARRGRMSLARVADGAAPSYRTARTRRPAIPSARDGGDFANPRRLDRARSFAVPRLVGTAEIFQPSLCGWRPMKQIKGRAKPASARPAKAGAQNTAPLAHLFLPGIGWLVSDGRLWRRKGMRSGRNAVVASFVAGMVDLMGSGFAMPKGIRRGNRRRYVEPDYSIGLFMESCLEKAPGKSVQARTMYQAYVAWANDTGRQAVTETMFGCAMKYKVVRDDRPKRHRYLDYRLRERSEPM